ncbi:maleylpyruvate isomerase family mycothiol-dependent enzyme [Streptomyces sp. NPDC003758]|uniref:Maleylpyruvate isomerase family mycothiol-dependent enzyme n=1 Tax=Streptomyces cynarae TaxID=2981134 RepID=A0ABY6DV10_9ACTN|nr:maleylpyruvate isomerase family mycothiol-dependent enzyme [Streptomyces cynarae]UXY18215.1 maleylpyruvate isomerase family mycothiol-dependent enzyme [Streptomyces cynarae]
MGTASPAGHPLPYDIYRQAIERETLRFAEVVRGADPGTGVPSCPDWTLAELTRHVGALQRWFSTLLSRLVQEPPRSRDLELGLPERAQEYADWVAEGVAAVAEVLRATDPQAGMWAWGEDQHARFWARRMLCETLVHRVDAERAVGRESEIDPVLAADGVDEFLVNLPYAGLFAPAVTKLHGNGEVIAFRCADSAGGTGEEWRVRLDPDGFHLLAPAAADEAPTGAVTAGVRGQAADLLLLLYGRRSYRDSAFDVSGEVAVLDRWFAHTAF